MIDVTNSYDGKHGFNIKNGLPLTSKDKAGVHGIGLEKKDELSQDEIKKKQDLQQQISELEQELQKIKAEKQNQKADREKNEDKNEPDRIKEAGKGENIDEYV